MNKRGKWDFKTVAENAFGVAALSRQGRRCRDDGGIRDLNSVKGHQGPPTLNGANESGCISHWVDVE